ncbi:MAG: penicillin-binding protein 2 [Halioglobus sp.]|nr:penicillin-binding protein 2 [Halioglobus sp.]
MKRRSALSTLPRWRFQAVVAGLIGLLGLVIWQLLSLQILDRERGSAFLKDQGAARSVRVAEIPAYRGVISDRHGEPLAVSTPVMSIWADPQVLAGTARLSELAAALGTSTEALKEKLARYAGKRFMYLERHWMPAEARRVLDLGIAGVYSQREYKRFYPAGPVAAQLVGFTSRDGKGIEGVELAYDDWLKGTPGKKTYIKDRRGGVVRDIGVLEEARSGRDLRLSIDLRLQYQQHRELSRAVTALRAESGSVVTLDARTGEVLALVNYPDYNPNGNKGDAVHRRNRAVTDAYEPGSTMKAMTLVAALESGRYTPATTIDTAPGWINVGGKVYEDPSNYKSIDLTRILQKSSQVGTTKLALDLGHEPIRDVLSRFGIGEPLGTGFPGENAGRLPARDRWHVSEQVSLAFGYGFTASPLQLAAAYATFASGGVRLPVSMLQLQQAPEGRRVVDADIAKSVLQMLHAVTLDDGTATRARVPGHKVGGKTGTVHKVGAEGYAKDRYVALFAGVAPVEEPRIASVVVINEPKGEDYGGGAAAAPVFSAIVGGALHLLNVPPDATAIAESRAASVGGEA